MTTDDQGGELRRALDENRHLRAEIERLRADHERLHERLDDLEANLEAALRAGKRQAAPFSRGEPKSRSQTPNDRGGRAARSTAGMGTVSRRSRWTRRWR